MTKAQAKIGTAVRVSRKNKSLVVGARGRIAAVSGNSALVYLVGNAGAAWVPVSALTALRKR